MDEVHSARTAGQRAGLITSALGLFLASVIAAVFGLTTYLRTPNGWIILVAAVVSVLGFARWAGGVAGVSIKKGGNPWLLGVALAFATVVVPAVGLSLVVWAVQQIPIGASHAVGELGSYVLKPLFWITAAGALPASALGLLYAQLVRRPRA